MTRALRERLGDPSHDCGGIVASMSRKDDCWDHALVASVFRDQ